MRGIGGSISGELSKIISSCMGVTWLSCLRKNVETWGIDPCRVVLSGVILDMEEKWVWKSLCFGWILFVFFFKWTFSQALYFLDFVLCWKHEHPALTLSCFAPSTGLFPLCWCVHKTVSRGNAVCFTSFLYLCYIIDLFNPIGCWKYILKCASQSLGCIPEEWCLWRCSHSLPESE